MKRLFLELTTLFVVFMTLAAFGILAVGFVCEKRNAAEWAEIRGGK